uniref:Uncharacterized protein n=1 Tax=Pavo cristatus TaxID=9049 RepID=A0A8C9F5G0_PAVCR
SEITSSLGWISVSHRCNSFFILSANLSIKVEFLSNMNFLHKTGGYFSQQCLSETSDFRFPREILKIFLQQTFQLLGKNLPKGVGNTSSTEKFQNGTHQQVGELEICLLEELPKARNSFQTQMLESTTLSMKKYLQRITSFLKDRQYSHCSWDAVQTELRSCLIISDSLMKTTQEELKNASATNRGM